MTPKELDRLIEMLGKSLKGMELEIDRELVTPKDTPKELLKTNKN